MNVIKTKIPDVLVFEPRVFSDQRGYFIESFRNDVIKEHIGHVNFVQDNESMSSRGVLRGLHYQKPPFTQSKLVRAVQGEVLDVAVDVRRGSPWFGKHVAVHLSGENKRQLWIPKGFAHGFLVLSPTAVFAYKCDSYYAPQADGGIRFDDPSLAIDWGVDAKDFIVSEKDMKNPFFDQVGDVFEYESFKKEKIYG